MGRNQVTGDLTAKLRNLEFLQSAWGSYTSFITRDDIIHLLYLKVVPAAG